MSTVGRSGTRTERAIAGNARRLKEPTPQTDPILRAIDDRFEHRRGLTGRDAEPVDTRSNLEQFLDLSTEQSSEAESETPALNSAALLRRAIEGTERVAAAGQPTAADLLRGALSGRQDYAG